MVCTAILAFTMNQEQPLVDVIDVTDGAGDSVNDERELNSWVPNSYDFARLRVNQWLNDKEHQCYSEGLYKVIQNVHDIIDSVDH